jgi:hypothetical protein
MNFIPLKGNAKFFLLVLFVGDAIFFFFFFFVCVSFLYMSSCLLSSNIEKLACVF